MPALGLNVGCLAGATMQDWRLAVTLDAAFCIQALEEALACHGPQEIFNTDRAANIPAPSFTELMKQRNVKISTDGRGWWWTTCSWSAYGGR